MTPLSSILLLLALFAMILFIFANKDIESKNTRSLRYFNTNKNASLKRDLIKQLESKYPYFAKSNKIQIYTKLSNEIYSDTIYYKYTENFENAVKEFNDFCSTNTISKDTIPNTELYSHKHGKCTFKFWAPDDFPIIQLPHESFCRVSTIKDLLQ